MTIEQTIEDIYTSLENDNENIDLHISHLKKIMKENDMETVTFQSTRLPINNREGRKTMQVYFKKRGVKVDFE